jgi:hypothetical protein
MMMMMMMVNDNKEQERPSEPEECAANDHMRRCTKVQKSDKPNKPMIRTQKDMAVCLRRPS